MLNQAIVDQVMSIAQQRLNGALWINGQGFRVRFLFQEGTPIALDLGRDKESLFADTLLEYHKISADLHRMLGDVIAANPGSSQSSPVREFLEQQQALAPGESEQALQALVEDNLVRALSGQVVDMTFVADEGVESFDFDRSAILIRIAADLLVATARAREEEDQAVRFEVGSWEAVYAITETEGESSPISEAERLVLDQADGRRSVEEIAQVLRDSSLRVGRAVRLLVAKKILRRVAGLGSKTRAALDAMRQEAAQQAVAVKDEAAQDRRGPNPWVLTFLVGVLALLALAGWLVVEAGKRQSALDDLSVSVSRSIAAREFKQAFDLVGDARTKAGNDLMAIQHADSLQKMVEDSVSTELKSIDVLRQSSDFSEAQARLKTVPPDARTQALREAILESEEAFRARSATLERQVQEALQKEDIAAALAVVDANPGPEVSKAADHIDRWRLSLLEQAMPPGAPLAKRQSLLAKVRKSRPSQAQEERLSSVDGDLLRQQSQLTADIRKLRALAETGAWKAALDGCADIQESIAGSTLEVDLKSLRDRCAAIHDGLTAYLDGVAATIRQGGIKELGEAKAKAETLVKDWSAAPEKTQVDAALAALREIETALARDTMLTQAQSLDAWIQAAGEQHPFIAAVTFRRDQIRLIETTTQSAIEAARRLAKEAEWEAALQSLESLVSRPEVRVTAALADAEKLLAEVRGTVKDRKAMHLDLDAALAAGDIAKARELAVKLSLKYLPLQIESVPPGAQIIQDGKPIGQTPLLLRISAADRSEAHFELRLAGYLPLKLKGTEAEAGWRLAGSLARAPVAEATADFALTARPAAADDRIWLAGRSAVLTVESSGALHRISLDASGGALAQPVYAPAISTDQRVLLATRDGVCLSVVKGIVSRLPQSGRSDLPPVLYRSQVVLDRAFLVVAGDDGRLHAVNLSRPDEQWHSEPGAPFACAPVLKGEHILVARRDGQLESVQADDGKSTGRTSIGKPVSAAWAEGGALSGHAGATLWSWSGGELSSEDAPAEAAFASKNCLVTPTGRVWQRSSGVWKDLGRVEGKPSGPPLVWQQAGVVVPAGKLMAVLGAKPFTVASDSEFLPPVAVPGGRLLVATVGGKILLYEP
ncbi:hypothetical protein LBMAG53_06500 [Planctomycetota bacterium]|nr:hypothetical protein LBMAG53_06500 [Planctomycetota bacterium]